jgi:drug/metabolite transporter (DMT)-like permease
MVTPYQVAYRYYSLVLVAFTVVCMPFWSATTDAYEKGDKRWIRMANRRMNLLTALTACAMILMTIVSPYVFQIWIGDKCHVPFSMTVLMAIYVFLLVMSIRYSYFLNGIGALRLQLYMTVMTIIFIPLAWFVSHTTHDILYFMGVMCVCIAPSILVNKIQFSKILKGTAIGIWRI